MDLKEAVSVWQASQHDSSRLRGAARVLTGIPHYFDADYIAGYEQEARVSRVTLDMAHTLMTGISASSPQTASDWHRQVGLPSPGFAGRGIQRKDKNREDGQIAAALRKGVIAMPLWGFSLDRAVADSYGQGPNGPGFMFELDGPFHGIAAWIESGCNEHDREIISSGIYKVMWLEARDDIWHVGLREEWHLRPTAP